MSQELKTYELFTFFKRLMIIWQWQYLCIVIFAITFENSKNFNKLSFFLAFSFLPIFTGDLTLGFCGKNKIFLYCEETV
ncbi:hypothetical protein BpHYR1_050656 [Brachionus plicatilis]|uniref:Uncharacterized protein n=1 Tax=Brachionus plicatilis TaxID=10195 RepID=A0A3M7QMX3_BRAPC|nr:hypothetical protein BpHYR1_050656 [Brachionus plicatilis]